MVVPSNGRNGRLTGSLPLATRMCAASSVTSLPSFRRTTTDSGEATRAVPKTGSIRFFLNRNRTPSVSPLTTSSFRASIAGTSIASPPTWMPWLAEPVVGQVIELARIEQRLARDAADVQAGAAQGRPLLDAGHLPPELRRPDRRDVTAGTRPDHYQVVTLGHAWLLESLV